MRRSTSAALTAAVTFTLASCSFGEPPEPEDQEPPNLPTPSQGPPEDPATVLDVVAEDLEIPWGLDFLPDGTAVVGERASGRLLAVTAGDDGAEEPEELRTIEVAPAGEGGLLGVAVSPRFDDDTTVYLYYTTDEDNRIAALDLEADADPEPILTGIPSGSNHNGGALAFGPDGALWAATGDAGVAEDAQDDQSLAGKILRLDTDGAPAEGNPDADSPVYSSGHRNVQGLAWNEAGDLYATEFGADLYDEVNLIEAGGNYGWPLHEGPAGDDAYIDPIVTWEPFEASCAGAVVVEQALITACLRGQRLWVVELDESGAPTGAPQPTLVSEFGRLRSIAMGPDGMLWVTTSNRDDRCIEGRGCVPDEADDRIIRFATSYAAEGRVLWQTGPIRPGAPVRGDRARSAGPRQRPRAGREARARAPHEDGGGCAPRDWRDGCPWRCWCSSWARVPRPGACSWWAAPAPRSDRSTRPWRCTRTSTARRS